MAAAEAIVVVVVVAVVVVKLVGVSARRCGARLVGPILLEPLGPSEVAAGVAVGVAPAGASVVNTRERKDIVSDRLKYKQIMKTEKIALLRIRVSKNYSASRCSPLAVSVRLSVFVIECETDALTSAVHVRGGGLVGRLLGAGGGGQHGHGNEESLHGGSL